MISVIMTTYNCAPYIYQAVNSILNQTYKDFELLIIDDGSSDNTEEIINDFKDKRIRYIKRAHFGRSASLNYALMHSSNDLIALMDADDISHPGRLVAQLHHFTNENEIVFTRTAYFKKNKLMYIIPSVKDMSRVEEKFYLHGHFNNSSSLFHKKIIINAGGYDENLSVFEDYDFWLRVQEKVRFIVISQILHYVRLRDNSLSTTNVMKKKKLLYSIQEPYFKYDVLSSKFSESQFVYKLLGWREFFYGDSKLCRNYWKKCSIKRWNVKLALCFILSFLPESTLNNIKNRRIRLLLNYYWSKLISLNKAQQEFYRIVRILD